MKLSLALFFAGVFGALGVLLFLVAFGTDYWLLATERCPSVENRMDSFPAEVSVNLRYFAALLQPELVMQTLTQQ